jgi:hypothetical protein
MKPRSSSSSGRPDAKGRSSGTFAGRDRKTYAPPKGEPWVWQTSELLSSAAWRAIFLMVEHRAHAALENGNLAATYDQLVEWGIGRRFIRQATEEAEFLGLVRTERGGRWAGTNAPSSYRLTFYASAGGTPPTNEWKGKTPEAIAEWYRDQARLRRARKTKGPKVVSIDGKPHP